MGLSLKTYQIFKDNETVAKELAGNIDSLEQSITQHEAAPKKEVRETKLPLIKRNLAKPFSNNKELNYPYQRKLNLLAQEPYNE